MSYPKFRKGTRVRVKDDLSVPRWATTGVVVFNPPPGNDWHEHPLVLWDSDGKKRHVSDSWLERANLHNNFLRASCGCGRVIRASGDTLDGPAIICSECGKEFTTE